MAVRPRAGVERGLPNSVFAVHAVSVERRDEGPDGRGPSTRTRPPSGYTTGNEEVVGMARVVGDGGSVYHVCDMAVHPDHQREGLGTELMDAVMVFIAEDAPPGAYVNLMADVDGFYERFGFEETRPASRGMFYRVE